MFAKNMYFAKKRGESRSGQTLCDPKDCSPPSSSVCGIPQARILWKPFPSSGDLPNSGIKFGPSTLQADSLSSLSQLILNKPHE